MLNRICQRLRALTTEGQPSRGNLPNYSTKVYWSGDIIDDVHFTLAISACINHYCLDRCMCVHVLFQYTVYCLYALSPRFWILAGQPHVLLQHAFNNKKGQNESSDNRSRAPSVCFGSGFFAQLPPELTTWLPVSEKGWLVAVPRKRFCEFMGYHPTPSWKSLINGPWFHSYVTNYQRLREYCIIPCFGRTSPDSPPFTDDFPSERNPSLIEDFHGFPISSHFFSLVICYIAMETWSIFFSDCDETGGYIKSIHKYPSIHENPWESAYIIHDIHDSWLESAFSSH